MIRLGKVVDGGELLVWNAVLHLSITLCYIFFWHVSIGLRYSRTEGLSQTHWEKAGSLR
jgi:hypothetical protein